MIISSSPLVSYFLIFKNIFKLNKPNNGALSRSYCYSRGAVALYFGVTTALKGKKGQLWVPSYFCNEVLEPIRNAGIKINYYPISLDMSPDWKQFPKKMLSNNIPKVFLLVHYFGFDSNIKKATDFCKKNALILIEDKAHSLEKVKENHEYITIYSPRKQLGLPDGGLLILPKHFTLIEHKLLEKPSTLNVLTWFFKRYLRLLVFKFKWFSEFLRDKRVLINNSTIPLKRMSNLSVRIMEDFYRVSIEKALLKRRKNYQYINNIIKELQLFNEYMEVFPDTVSPFMLSVYINGDTKKVKRNLNSVGIPAASWPDLPPEVINSPLQYKNAHYLYNNLLHLPVHQNLSQKQLEFISITLKSLNQDLAE